MLICGTTSDAGKSVLVAGLCRFLARQGVDVVPFKAQNMSNNSFVTLDGGEIGRAQAVQARAAFKEPSVRFNPVLLKPGSDRTSQVVVLGKVVGEVSALSYRDRKQQLLDTVLSTLDGLRRDHEVVVCEGAGSPAEINLRPNDIANMGLATRADLPVLVVGDIDRGGVFAHLFGTLAVLDAADQALVAGFVVNKFRGDPRLLEPGLRQITSHDRAAGARRAAVARGTLARRRGFVVLHGGWRHRPATSADQGLAAGRRDPVAAHLERDGRRGAGV